jgi:hypothetical protein
LNTIEGVDSGKTIADKSTAVTTSDAAYAIVPVKVIPAVTTTIAGGQ